MMIKNFMKLSVPLKFLQFLVENICTVKAEAWLHTVWQFYFQEGT